MTPSCTCVELRQITARYSYEPVLREFSLQAQGGELLAVLGPSGCGKTTVLRVIAGLLPAQSGEILFDGVSLAGVSTNLRGAAVVFQKPLLFPHLTVAENVAFGLTMRGVAKSEVAVRVEQALQMVELGGFQQRRPQELSGGQGQRVSLARALVTHPRVLLLDEPFSALDSGLRIRMRALLKDLQKHLKLTTIFVTHDQEEAAFLADRVAVLLDGRIEQVSAVAGFYSYPCCAKVAEFLGWKIFAGRRFGRRVDTALGAFLTNVDIESETEGGNCQLAFHPHSARLATAPLNIGENIMSGRIESVIALGARWRCILRLKSGDLMQLDVPNTCADIPATGREVLVELTPSALRVF